MLRTFHNSCTRAVRVEVSLPRPRGRRLIFSPTNALNPVIIELLVLSALLGYSFCSRHIRV